MAAFFREGEIMISETEIKQKYKSYCSGIINEPISYEQYKQYLIKQFEPKHCPKCNRIMIRLHNQFICHNEYCGHREDICK
jgi:ATP-dependent Clp protease adapter protein ClpS